MSGRDRRGGRLNSVARVQALHDPETAGGHDADPAAATRVGCRGCDCLVPMLGAVDLSEIPRRTGRTRDSDSAWARSVEDTL